MFKRLSVNNFYTGYFFDFKTTLSRSALIMSFIIFYFYMGEALALQEGDRVAEIASLTTDVTKIAKNGCYITGCASALIGSVWAVAQQSLKVFGVAAGVTLLAFKAPSFFTSAMLI